MCDKRGLEILKHNPRITKLIEHDKSTPTDKLAETIDYIRRKNKCDKVIDFCESIEVALSQHPRSPNYKLPKKERIARFNRNFYEYAFEHAKLPWDGVDLTPELFFEPHEQYEIRDEGKREASWAIKKNCFNLLIGMSGSGTNKAWPYTEELAKKICGNYPDVHIITVGDERCRLIEPEIPGRVLNLSGRIPMRMSLQLTGLVDLVIAPDTGITHATGAHGTPLIALLGHNTKECITKHFKNDYSIEADPKLAPCAPCMFLIYDQKLQCPIHLETGASLCMGEGLPMEQVYERFQKAYVELKQRSKSA